MRQFGSVEETIRPTSSLSILGWYPEVGILWKANLQLEQLLFSEHVLERYKTSVR